jgi:uncharacterized protein
LNSPPYPACRHPFARGGFKQASPASCATAGGLKVLSPRGLYPCGEGAGYADGILSAGVDGIKVAEAVARSLS